MDFSLLRRVAGTDTLVQPRRSALCVVVCRQRQGLGRSAFHWCRSSPIALWTATSQTVAVSRCTGSYMTLTGRWRCWLLVMGPQSLYFTTGCLLFWRANDNTCVAARPTACGETQSALNSRSRRLVLSNMLPSSSSLGHPSLVNCNSKQ